MDDNFKARQEELRKSIDELKIAIEKAIKRNKMSLVICKISLMIFSIVMIVIGIKDILIVVNINNAIKIIYSVVTIFLGISILNMIRKEGE